MGGNAFKGDDALDTPPMSPSVYSHVKTKCTSELKKLRFPRVETPIEAPEKKTFGDIDILVCLEGTRFPPTANAGASTSTWDEIEKALGSISSKPQSRTGPDKQDIIDSKSLAIPWPAGSGSAGNPKAAPARRYIQVDVRLCDTVQELEWRVFKHNHGDLWNMLGQTIRPFGLTANEDALYIRIPEIEKHDKKKARVFLSSDRTKVIDFLGLSRRNGELDKPFKSVSDLLEYAATNRWFMLWPTDQDADEDKAADKSRVEKRPVFARWVNEFIPACRAKGRFMVRNPGERTRGDVRDEVRREAFKIFPGSEAAYKSRLADWNREQTRVLVKNKIIKEDACLPADVRHALPAPREKVDDLAAYTRDLERNWRAVLRSALAKVIIDDDDGSFEGVDAPRLRDAEGVLRVDDVKDWINRNWEKVGQAAWRENCRRARESVERKQKANQDAQGGKAAAGAAAGGKR